MALENRKGKSSSISIANLATISILVLAGGFFLYVDFTLVREAGKKRSLVSINEQRAKFAGWPSVKGHLDQLDIKSFNYLRRGQPGGTDFWPEVKYQYQVGDQQYNGNCLRRNLTSNDRDVYFCSDPLTGLKAAKAKVAQYIPAKASDNRRQWDNRHEVYSYYPNKEVAVYYDPSNPSDSMLDHQWQPLSWSSYYDDEILGISFCSALALMMLGIPVIAVVTSARKQTRLN